MPSDAATQRELTRITGLSSTAKVAKKLDLATQRELTKIIGANSTTGISQKHRTQQNSKTVADTEEANRSGEKKQGEKEPE